MKRFIGFGITLFFLFIASSLYGQSSIVEQRLIGSWTVAEQIRRESNWAIVGNIWTFNADGTFSITGVANWTGRWAVSANGQNIILFNASHAIHPPGSSLIFISPAGTMAFTGLATFVRN